MTSTLNAIPAGLFQYDANDRLLTDSYDANGNTIVNASVTNVYDFENHLVRHDGVTIVYDGDGNRVAETVGGVTTKYLVDTLNPTGYAQVVEELQNSSSQKHYTVGLTRVSETLVQSNGARVVRYYGYDGHGSVRNITDEGGTVLNTYDYEAFGNVINQTGTVPNVYMFAGEAYDSTLGLYYNRARYLDVRVGRFWGMDTFEGRMQDPSSLHKYLYVGDDPVNQTDESGKDVLDSLAAVGLQISISVAT